MFGFLSLVALVVIAYQLWRITDQLPDLIFRMSEIQRDVAEIRRTQSGTATPQGAADTGATAAGSTAKDDATGGADGAGGA